MYNKYRNHIVTYQGEKFDSSKEANRYFELMAMQKVGIITNLERQVKFVLIPAQREPDQVGARGGIKKGKVIEKECSYYADFVYNEGGKKVVEDVKGFKGGGAYEVFKIKRKLMLQIYGIRIREV